MKDLIDRQEAIDVIKAISNLDEKTKGGIIATFSLLDSAQPERKTGRWISMTSNSNNYRCSVCGRMLVGITDGKNMVTKNYPYCHCGAKMLKEGEG